MAACVDLYELTMGAGYFAQGIHTREAVFQLSVRRLPRNRSFLVTAGLEQALHYLTEMRFDAETIRYLRHHESLRQVPREFFRYLRDFRFSGDVLAVPEGTLLFPEEPVLFVRAPLIEAQIVETYLLTTLNLQTAIASKAARMVEAARGRSVADFGARRAHGPQTGLLAARGAFIGGCATTSNVLAARALGIPATGTQAHSWIMAFPDEREAFRTYAEVFPDSCVLLIDTYDTLQGARRATEIGDKLKGVRIDSGNLSRLSREVRRILDQAGLKQARIIASGDLNEWKIDRLLRNGAPIDLFGVGSELATSRDDPVMAGVYKLVKIGRGRESAAIKLSSDKVSLPFLKQVRRRADRNGRFIGDVLCLHGEHLEGEALIRQYMRGGRIIRKLPALPRIRKRARRQIECLSPELRKLADGAEYPVEISRKLRSASDEAIRKRLLAE